MLGNANLKSVAARHNATPAQIALAWLLRHPDLVVIPKASNPDHIRDNRAATYIELTAQDLKDLDQSFSLPNRKIPLAL